MRRGLVYAGLVAVVAIIVTVLLLKFPKDEDLQRAVSACVVVLAAGIGMVGQMLATRDTRPQVTRLSVEEPVSLNFTDSDGLDPPEVTGPSIKFECNSELAHVQLSARLEQRQKSIGPLPRWQLLAKAHASLRAGPTGYYGPEKLWMEIELLSRPRPLPIRFRLSAKTAEGDWKSTKSIEIPVDHIILPEVTPPSPTAADSAASQAPTQP